MCVFWGFTLELAKTPRYFLLKGKHASLLVLLSHSEEVVIFMESESDSCPVMSNSLWPRGLWPARLLCPWNSSGKNTGVGSQFLLRGFSQPRGWTQVSCIAGRFFTIWVTSVWRENGKALWLAIALVLVSSSSIAALGILLPWLRNLLPELQFS